MITIRLAFKSKKGKDRLRRWGVDWFVIEKRAGRLLIASIMERDRFSQGIQNLDSARWIDQSTDADFRIVSA
jgi:hypothetical protein